MAARWMLRAVLGAWLCTGAGCDVFDEELKKELDEATEDDDDMDGEEDAGVDAGIPLFKLADACEGNRPVVESNAKDRLIIPVTGLHSNSGEAGSCAIGDDLLPKADGFFQITATAGQRWHFHLYESAGQNLALAALPANCDVRVCQAFADQCGTNQAEHFTFVPQAAGTYVIMVEGIDPSLGGDLMMLAVSPKCGDGTADHSEVCDDGNSMSRDGCDPQCRQELLAQNSMEKEPNDDSYGANVLEPPDFDRSIVVRGAVPKNECKPDYFLLRVDAVQLLTAELLDAAGGACTDAPKLQLQLREGEDDLRDGATLKTANPMAAGGCPSFADFKLEPGTYFVRLAPSPDEAPAADFDYRLKLTLAPEPPPP